MAVGYFAPVHTIGIRAMWETARTHGDDIDVIRIDLYLYQYMSYPLNGRIQYSCIESSAYLHGDILHPYKRQHTITYPQLQKHTVSECFAWKFVVAVVVAVAKNNNNIIHWSIKNLFSGLSMKFAMQHSQQPTSYELRVCVFWEKNMVYKNKNYPLNWR